MIERKNSDMLYERACRVMVGGVNSPVRSFKFVNSKPLFIKRGYGSKIQDFDGNEYLDYVLSYGALVHGHTNNEIVSAVIEAIKNGTTFGAPSEPELILAEKICESFRSIEMVRLVNSGTEATMSAIRLARAYTGKSIIVKFDGCYHGHADLFLVNSGSGLATLSIPSSEGVDINTVAKTVSISYNDTDQLENVFSRYKNGIAAVIVEPIAGNMGVVPPKDGFLERIRELCNQNDSLLIFDEVITGFRVARGGAQELYGIDADITCLGKIIGGGFPVGAFGARKEIMKKLAPEGKVYQAGTLSGNPVSCAAGLASVSLLNSEKYSFLEEIGSRLEKGISKIASEEKIGLTINRVGSMLSIFFTEKEVWNFNDVKSSDSKKFVLLHSSMLKNGIYLPPSPYETIFLSTEHTDEDIEKTISAFSKFAELLKHEYNNY